MRYMFQNDSGITALAKKHLKKNKHALLKLFFSKCANLWLEPSTLLKIYNSYKRKDSNSEDNM